MKQVSMLIVSVAILAGVACESRPTSPSLTPTKPSYALDGGTIVRVAFAFPAEVILTQGEVIVVTGADGEAGVLCWPNIRTDVVISESFGKTFLLADQVLPRGTRLRITQFEKTCGGFFSYFAEVI